MNNIGNINAGNNVNIADNGSSIQTGAQPENLNAQIDLLKRQVHSLLQQDEPDRIQLHQVLNYFKRIAPKAAKAFAIS